MDKDELPEVHLRLAGATIENLNWQEFVVKYDRPAIGAVFKRFNIRPVSVNYTVSKGKQTKGRKRLISNF